VTTKTVALLAFSVGRHRPVTPEIAGSSPVAPVAQPRGVHAAPRGLAAPQRWAVRTRIGQGKTHKFVSGIARHCAGLTRAPLLVAPVAAGA